MYVGFDRFLDNLNDTFRYNAIPRMRPFQVHVELTSETPGRGAVQIFKPETEGGQDMTRKRGPAGS